MIETIGKYQKDRAYQDSFDCLARRWSDANESIYNLFVEGKDHPNVTTFSYLDEANEYASYRVENMIYVRLLDHNDQIPFTSSKDRQFIILHHNDLDGYGSAALAKDLIDERCVNTKFIEYNYQFPETICNDIDKLRDGNGKNILVIVDLSIPNKYEFWQNVLKLFDKVIWVDHHKTSLPVAEQIVDILKQSNNSGYGELEMYIDTAMSSTMQMFLFQRDTLALNTYNWIIPWAISCYDTWNKDTMALYEMGLWLNQYIFDIGTCLPNHEVWKTLFYSEAGANKILSDGYTLFSLNEIKNRVLYNAECVYKTYWEDVDNNNKIYAVWAMNAYGNSLKFADPNIPSNTIKVLFRIKGNRFALSAYNDTAARIGLDLGAILREVFGGGGHPGAAGFNIKMDDLNDKINQYNMDHDVNEKMAYIDKETDLDSVRYDPTLHYIIADISKIILNEWVTREQAAK